MTEEGLSYGPGEGKALGEHLCSFNWEPPLYATARRMLAVAGRWPDGILIEHEEGTPAALASEWLINFRRLTRDWQRVAGGDTGSKALSALFYSAQRLGLLEERFFWRHGVDDKTGAPREALALERRRAREAYAHNNEGRDTANAERNRTAEVWREIARRVARENPAKRGKLLELAIVAELKRHGVKAAGWETIRKVLPKRKATR